MAAACPTPQKKKKKKATGFPLIKRGKIKARIFGNLVKAVVSMLKPGDQGNKIAAEAGGAPPPPALSGYKSKGIPNV